MATREGVSGAPTLKAAPVGCSNAVCGLVTASEPVAGKKVRLTVDVGEEQPLTVLSAASVDTGARIVVALVGSSIGDTEVTIPTICDAAMLGWDGRGASGPATLPKAFSPGDAAPNERPKAGRAAAAEVDKLGNVVDGAGVDALFVSKPKLSKAEKATQCATHARQSARTMDDGRPLEGKHVRPSHDCWRYPKTS